MYSLDRVLADIRDACDHGARTIFLVDDNITLNVRRFEALWPGNYRRAAASVGLHRAGDDLSHRQPQRDLVPLI
jgi:hypothetical protein